MKMMILRVASNFLRRPKIGSMPQRKRLKGATDGIEVLARHGFDAEQVKSFMSRSSKNDIEKVISSMCTHITSHRIDN